MEDQGLLGATPNVVARGLGPVARLDHSPLAGWLWVTFTRCEVPVAVSDLGINRAQLHSGLSFVMITFGGLYSIWKMSLVALSIIICMQLDKYTAFEHHSIWSLWDLVYLSWKMCKFCHLLWGNIRTITPILELGCGGTMIISKLIDTLTHTEVWSLHNLVSAERYAEHVSWKEVPMCSSQGPGWIIFRRWFWGALWHASTSRIRCSQEVLGILIFLKPVSEQHHSFF